MSFPQPEPNAPQIDPVTGLPIPAGGAIPLGPGAGAAPDPMAMDPMAAAAEMAAPIPDSMGQIDPMTGQPLPPPLPTAAELGPQLPAQAPSASNFMQTIMPPNVSEPVDPVQQAEGLIEIGPSFLPPWWKEPKKPKKARVMDRANKLKADHELRVAQSREMTEWLNHDKVGIFPGDEEDIESGMLMTMVLSALRDEHDTAKTNIGRMTPYVRMEYRDANLRDEVAAVEDAVYYFMACEERQFLRQYGSLLRYALPDILMRTGMLVGVDVLDPTNRQCGLYMDTLDPLSCYPEFEGNRGLSGMYRVYDDYAGNVVGNYGDGGGKVERLMAKLCPQPGGGYDPYQYVCITEYWDRAWVSVLVNGEEVLTRRHLLGRVPFTVMFGAWGAPANTVVGTSRSRIVAGEWGQFEINDRSKDLSRIMQPFLYRRLMPHAAEEAAAGYVLSQIRNAMFPMMTHVYDPMNAMESKPKIRYGRKVVNRVPAPDTLTIEQLVPDPTTANTIQTIFQQNRMTGMAPAAQQGQAAPQTSGDALDSMIDQGAGRHVEVSSIVSEFRRERSEWRLEITRDWMPVMGDTSEDNAGVMLVPNRRTYGRYRTPAHKLTRKMLERTGVHLEFTLKRWRPDPAAAQYFSTLRAANLVSQFEAISHLDIVQDALQEIERMDDEEMNMVPEIAQQRALHRLEKLIDEAVDQDDYDSADYNMVAAIVIQNKIQQQLIAERASMAMAGMAGVTPGMGMAAQVGAQPGTRASMSDRAQNQGQGPTAEMVTRVGRNGGRPPGTSASGGPAQLPSGGQAGAI